MMTREIASAYYPAKPLGEVVDFLDNLRRPVTKKDRKPGEFPYFGANGQQGTIDGYLFDEPLILLAEDGGLFDQPHRGIAYGISGKTWVNNHAHVLRPNSNIHFDFLRRVLENYDVRPYITGSTRSKLTKGQAQKIAVPLPPLDEQKRIAAILDRADALRRLRRHAIDRLNSIGLSIFNEMYCDPARLGNYPLKQLSEVADLINGDRSSNYPSGDDIVEQGVLFLNTKNIVGTQLDLTSCNYITEKKFATLTQGKLNRHDLVITLRGTLGRCAEFDNEYQTGFINAQLMIIRPSKLVSPSFLRSYLSHPQTQARLLHNKSGAAVPQLTAKQVAELEIVVPPVEHQKVYEERLKFVQSCRDEQLKGEEKQNLLFASLQQRAFCGELSA